MPSNEQRRQNAKRKLERQLARRAERARRRRIIAVSATVAAVIVVVGGVYFFSTRGEAEQPTSGACKYRPTPNQPAAKPVDLPEDPDQASKEGNVKATFKTSQGDIPVTMDRAQAPCTVQSMRHLIEQKYFDGTPCHRQVNSDTLKVLQCGDPTGKGTGGPGYTVPDEKPKNLKDAPQSSAQQKVATYPRGSLAMANSGSPNSGGSQFFLVTEDSSLPPDYTVFGKVDKAGLATLDKIAANGIEGGKDDGAPKKPVDIEQAQLLS